MTSTLPKTDLERAAGDGVEKTPVEARQGVKTRHMRWVLVISLALGVVVLGGAWLAFVGSQSQTTAPPPSVAAAGRL